MQDQLEELSELTDALYQAELSKMQAINAHAARLRHDLSELDRLRRNNAALPPEELNTVRQIGADVLWEGWVSRTRAELNTQLAQVLAQKARMTVALRRAFGKQMAATDMLRQAKKAARQNLEKRHAQTRDDLQYIRMHRPE